MPLVLDPGRSSRKQGSIGYLYENKDFLRTRVSSKHCWSVKSNVGLRFAIEIQRNWVLNPDPVPIVLRKAREQKVQGIVLAQREMENWRVAVS